MHNNYTRIRFFLFLLVAFPVFSLVKAQNHEARLNAIDIEHYRFELELSDETDEIKGKAEVKIAFKKTGPFELDLYTKDEQGKGMTVSSVEENGKSVPFEAKGETLSIIPSSSLDTDEPAVYTIQYQGIPADGLIISKNKFGDRTFFGDNWPNRAHHWLPTVDHPSDKATVEFIVSAPDHYQVVANGRQIEESSLGKGKRLTHWKTDVKLPTKIMVIGAADFAVQHAGFVGEAPVSSWVYPNTKEKGFYDYALAVKILTFYTQYIAPYPYEKLANVQSKTRYGGMENASCIFYSEESVDGKRGSEALIAHEIVHQWFGNSASEANWHHIWLSEGFATYLTHVYFEQVHGEEARIPRMEADRRRVLNWEPTRTSPVVDTRVKDYNRLLNANSYQKGGWVLHMLRKQVGDEAFVKGIRLYYDRFQLSNALTSDLQKAMEETSGQKLDWFFKQWIFTAGHPNLKVRWSWSNKKKICTLEVEQLQEVPFRFPLDVFFPDGAAGENIIAQLEVTQGKETFEVELPLAPHDVQLDPMVNLLFEAKVEQK